ncbi:MAG: mechanosensitive ion channel, partial [Cyanobacteriota bacterium]|nr:mechanosensitive ion channel [Cyanobacteriota bacterium]
MNETWVGIVQIMGVGVPIWVHPSLAQAPNQRLPVVQTGVGYIDQIIGNLSLFVPQLLGAIAILLIGLIIAGIARAVTKGLLNRTNVDNKLAEWVTGRQGGQDSPQIEDWISGAVYWIIIVFTVVAVLNTLNLQAVSQPLNNFLNQITGFLPKLLGAAIFLGVAWLLATLVKLITTRALRVARLDERLNQQVETPPARPGEAPPRPTNQFSLADTIGNALYWFIFLLFLPTILESLGLQGTLQPVQVLLNNILGILPNILGAVLIGAAGWLLAQVVRRIVTNLLAASGTDQLGARFGLRQTAGGQSLSWIIGTIVYVLILIPTAIAALQKLQIEAISAPAIA